MVLLLVTKATDNTTGTALIHLYRRTTYPSDELDGTGLVKTSAFYEVARRERQRRSEGHAAAAPRLSIDLEQHLPPPPPPSSC